MSSRRARVEGTRRQDRQDAARRPPRRSDASRGERRAQRVAPRGVRMAQASLEDEAAARAFLAQPGPRAVVFAVNSLAPLALICSAEGCTVATCDANEDDGEEAALALGATSLPWVSLCGRQKRGLRAARRPEDARFLKRRLDGRPVERARRLRGDGDGRPRGITRRRRRREEALGEAGLRGHGARGRGGSWDWAAATRSSRPGSRRARSCSTWEAAPASTASRPRNK